MQLIFEDKQKRVIKGREEINFSSFSSFHFISVTARARSAKQISKEATDDEDLIVKIDSKTFPVSAKNKRLINSPAAFSGGQLHSLLKTVFFLTFLEGKEHSVTLITDKPHDTATFESLEIYSLELNQSLTFEIEKQAEDGDRRPWITFALDNFPLAFVTSTITYSRRKRDSDDVKIIIDGKIQKNIRRTIKHFLWRFAGSLLPKAFPTLTETETFVPNLPAGLHYIELHADRMPVLHKLIINFGERPKPPISIPTVDDPKWTASFNDDSETMLLARAIYGEAGGESTEAKTAVGWAIRNRTQDQRWASTYHGVILQPNQYEPFGDPKSEIFKRITGPLLDNPLERKAWEESYHTAEQVISGKVPDPTNGANHFYATTIAKPYWADESKLTLQIGIIRFYKL